MEIPWKSNKESNQISMILLFYFLHSYANVLGKPTEVFIDIYVESFGNIMEMNMVRDQSSLTGTQN